MQSLILSNEDLREVTRRVGIHSLMEELIQQLEAVLGEFNEQQMQCPTREGFDYQTPYPGLLEWMPILEHDQRITIKTVGYHPRSPQVWGLPTILSTIACYDIQTGHLAALADGTFITALRTGAASAIASRVLAQRDSTVLGVIGCGAQAVAQVHGLARTFDLTRVLAFDIDRSVADSFADRTASLRGAASLEVIEPEDLAENLVGEADILCIATSVEAGQGPVFEDQHLKPWMHINAIGSDFPGKTETPHSVLVRSLVCPDFRPQAVKEGECQQLTEEEIGPDLVELVQRAEQYHTYRNQLTVFDSTGWALEDHVAMMLMLNYAEEMGLGAQMAIESIDADPRDPYGFLRSYHMTPAPFIGN